MTPTKPTNPKPDTANTTRDGDEVELKKAILKQGTVRFATGAFTQRSYSNGTVSPVEHRVQEIVEIGIDDLMSLISAHTGVKVRKKIETMLNGAKDELQLEKAYVNNEFNITYYKNVIDFLSKRYELVQPPKEEL